MAKNKKSIKAVEVAEVAEEIAEVEPQPTFAEKMMALQATITSVTGGLVNLINAFAEASVKVNTGMGTMLSSIAAANPAVAEKLIGFWQARELAWMAGQDLTSKLGFELLSKGVDVVGTIDLNKVIERAQTADALRAERNAKENTEYQAADLERLRIRVISMEAEAEATRREAQSTKDKVDAIRRDADAARAAAKSNGAKENPKPMNY